MNSPRMTVALLTAITVLLTLTSACGLGGLQGELRGAIPGEEAVKINAPEGNSNALTSSDATLGDWSDYYLITRKMTRGVNHGVVGMIALIHAITRLPATSCDDSSCTWGPGSDTLDPAEYRLIVRKDGEGEFSYSLEGRPKGTEDTDENYLAMVTGTSDVSSGIEHGLGSLQMLVDNWVILDPTACGAGTLDVLYDTTEFPQYLAVQFVDFIGCDDGDSAEGEAPSASSYYYSREEDGGGNFQFVMIGDVHDGAITPALDETFAIRSRWNAMGEGRSDVIINGGDLLLNDGLEAVTAAECWDAGFKTLEECREYVRFTKGSWMQGWYDDYSAGGRARYSSVVILAESGESPIPISMDDAIKIEELAARCDAHEHAGAGAGAGAGRTRHS